MGEWAQTLKLTVDTGPNVILGLMDKTKPEVIRVVETNGSVTHIRRDKIITLRQIPEEG
jgi:mevalonate pyrophosphate decarboxylase